MKKKYYRILCLALSSSLVLSGCSLLQESETAESVETTETETEETEDIDEESEETTEEVDADDETTNDINTDSVESVNDADTGSEEGDSVENTEEESQEDDNTSNSSSDDDLITPVEMIDTDDQFTERDLDWSYDDSDPQYIELNNENTDVSGISGVSFSDNVLTITEEGVYVLSSSLSGRILVNCDDDSAKVQLVLSDVTITNDDGPCILAYGADKLFITFEGENTLSDSGTEYAQSGLSDKTEDGVIFADCDLTLNGSGSLTINAGYDNAIVCKEDIAITGGMYEISAQGKGMEANDSIRIAAGVFVITSEDDCINTDNEEEEGKGYIYIEDGSFTLKTSDDGIHAATALLITGGTITITESYEGLEGDSVDILGGTIDITSSDDGINASTGSGSGSDFGVGAKSGEDNNKDLDDAPDMADSESPDNIDFGDTPENEPSGEIPDNNSKTEPNGEETRLGAHDEISENAGDTEDRTTPAPDDLDSDMAVDPDENADSNDWNPKNEGEIFSFGESGGEDNFSKENIQAERENEDFVRDEIPSDDNAVKDEQTTDNNKDFSAPGGSGGHGGGMGFSSQPAYIRISGGTIYINASGDGLDSNGDLYIDGGEIYIDGPTNSGNGSIDYGDGDAEGIITGGTIIALGSSGMAENFSESSTQYVVMVTLDETAQAGSDVILEDSDGSVIISYTSEKAFDNVIISTPELAEGTYILTTGDDTTEIEITDIVTEIGNNIFGMSQKDRR